MADIALLDRLPILDARDIAADPDGFRRDLQRAARDVGFFYLVGHGITSDIIDAARQQARAFFALPEAEKLAIQMVRSPHFRGYNLAGQELTRGRRDWR
ncbi:MAG: 2-oxoglutarate and iron-dependent oxygenase domain-containing protein, partial [Acetobacteraceae bacterium]|nr:2-oxoglutarate and iron-dependent oxygenase domain-containing protein [Acetobacteraceae bacterium]